MVYGIGIPVILYFYYLGWERYPLTSLTIYGLLSGLTIQFYIPIFRGTEIPTSIIISSFIKKKQQTLDDLVGQFSNSSLIWKRIDNLAQAGFVTQTGSRVYITWKGSILARGIAAYQNIFHRKLTG
jgi:hypothetical protein